MCGIVGVYQPGGFPDLSDIKTKLGKAADAVSYRGPDASGIEIVRERGVGFGHRRLSILDIDSRSNQPMSSHDGRILLTYNGEIYNFKELRTELESQGTKFRTTSDTEVLIEGYRAWGLSGMLQRAVGMFAFALYDKEKQKLFLTRDRAGQKPLYYSFMPAGGVVFASEMRSLLILKPQAKSLDPAGLDAYLGLKMSPSTRT
jgi:asparagine synthase (glutamine-hydrolysing)